MGALGVMVLGCGQWFGSWEWMGRTPRSGRRRHGCGCKERAPGWRQPYDVSPVSKATGWDETSPEGFRDKEEKTSENQHHFLIFLCSVFLHPLAYPIHSYWILGFLLRLRKWPQSSTRPPTSQGVGKLLMPLIPALSCPEAISQAHIPFGFLALLTRNRAFPTGWRFICSLLIFPSRLRVLTTGTTSSFALCVPPGPVAPVSWAPTACYRPSSSFRSSNEVEGRRTPKFYKDLYQFMHLELTWRCLLTVHL